MIECRYWNCSEPVAPASPGYQGPGQYFCRAHWDALPASYLALYEQEAQQRPPFDGPLTQNFGDIALSWFMDRERAGGDR